VVALNPAGERIFGVPAADAVGREVGPLIDGPIPKAGLHECLLRRTDGDPRPVELEIGPVVAPAGFRVVVVRELGERESLERQLQQAQRMESVGLLAGGIAHDFNNILTGIITFAALGKRRAEPGSPLHGELEEIEQQGRRASGLVRQLLAFSRTQQLAKQPVDLGDVVRNFEKFLRRVLGEQIDLEVVAERELGPVLADPGQLEQVLMNLCLNARDAMPRGGRLVIETRNVELDPAFCQRRLGASPGPYVELRVSDTGVGMTPEMCKRIFEPFFTTKAPGKGTGLGLSVVYGIIRQHGGIIDLESAPGRGTRVSIYLARAAAPAAERDARATEVPRGGQETILIADDHAGARKAAVRILEAYGYHVLAAPSGEEAVQLFDQHRERVALVILEAVMPRMSGAELYASLRERKPDLRCLLVSGHTTSVIGRNIPQASASRVLHKPFNPEDLGRRVREALDRPAPSSVLSVTGSFEAIRPTGRPR
jgi:two-component system NtrC family sensor kinase